MMTNKHPKSKHPSDADLKHNPGIGTSRGTGEDGDFLDGENTFEGDVLNDTERDGSVNPNRRGRENK